MVLLLEYNIFVLFPPLVRGPKDPEAFLIDPNRNSVTIVGDNGFLTVHDFLVIQQWGKASVISADFQLDHRSILK